MKNPTPFRSELIKAAVYIAAGLLCLIQPWLSVVRVLGGFIVAIGAILEVSLLIKRRKALQMMKTVVAAFSGGDAVYKNGVLADGQLFDFSTFGTSLTGAGIRNNKLIFAYRYVVRGKTRGKGEAILTFAPEEEALAREALAQYALPSLPVDNTAEEAEKPALPDSTGSGKEPQAEQKQSE